MLICIMKCVCCIYVMSPCVNCAVIVIAIGVYTQMFINESCM